ncbi:MAG: DnaD domain protein [Clostridia bacterium]|nr:DnaD domain protein [Clostridia bacterium]
MSFCSFSKDFNLNADTSVDNKFISSYLPDATGDAVKVYLYGLYTCSNGDEEISLAKFAENVKLTEETVIDCFKFWEEFGIVYISSTDPFLVRYLPINDLKPRKFKPEKYTEFNRSLQVLIEDRMITTNEFSAYFSVMEDYGIKPEAMLMIVKYCVDLKGPSIGMRYILKVANDFAARGLTTTAKIEKELSDYTLRSGELGELISAVNLSGKPEMEDIDLYNKWIKDYRFEKNAIVFVAKTAKCKSMKKLDKELTTLFGAKRFSVEEISGYYKEKNKTTDLAYKINRALSVYVEVIDPVVENYVSPWLNKGYDDETLIFIANVCFKRNRRTLEDMNDVIERFYKNGYITMDSIAEYIKATSADDVFIRQIIAAAGISRKVTEWDRENLRTWRSWNFSDEMIIEAAKLSVGKSSPLSYINAVLSGWKSENIFTPDKIAVKPSGKKIDFAISTRSYTKDELDEMMDNFDDFDL